MPAEAPQVPSAEVAPTKQLEGVVARTIVDEGASSESPSPSAGAGSSSPEAEPAQKPSRASGRKKAPDLAVVPDPSPFVEKVPVTVHLTSDVIDGLTRLQMELRLAKKLRRSDTTIGSVMDMLLRKGLNLPAL